MERRRSVMRGFYGINTIIENEDNDDFYDDDEDDEKEWCD
jgi:hypothetical protein